MNKYNHVISLGTCCETSFVIRNFFDTPYYPFDWFAIDNIIDVINIIDNDFEDFLNLHYDNEKKLIKISKYQIYSSHFASIDECKSKLQRRVDRFKNVLLTGDKLLFIVKMHYSQQPDNVTILNLKNVLLKKTKNPFLLLVVKENINNDVELYSDSECIIDTFHYSSRTIQRIYDYNNILQITTSFCDCDNNNEYDVWKMFFNKHNISLE
jgi:hypothetical protein